MKAEMQLTILEDGTISIQTGNMAGDHHASADEQTPSLLAGL
jgi:hypothetical protein